MGISAGATILNSRVSQDKYGGATPVTIPPTKEIVCKQRGNLPQFKTMLMENDKITLSRLQIFAWTWIGIIIYLITLFSEAISNIGNVQYLSIPDMNVQFAILMGLSQGTYIINKAIKPQVFSINEIRPKPKVELKSGSFIDILGSNFGQEEGTIWIECYRSLDTEDENTLHEKAKKVPKTKTDKTIYRITDYLHITKKDKEIISNYEKKLKEETQFDKDHLIKQIKSKVKSGCWKDNKITVEFDDETVKEIVNLNSNDKIDINTCNFLIRVEKDGLLTYANSDAMFNFHYVSGPAKQS